MNKNKSLNLCTNTTLPIKNLKVLSFLTIRITICRSIFNLNLIKLKLIRFFKLYSNIKHSIKAIFSLFLIILFKMLTIPIILLLRLFTSMHLNILRKKFKIEDREILILRNKNFGLSSTLSQNLYSIWKNIILDMESLVVTKSLLIKDSN